MLMTEEILSTMTENFFLSILAGRVVVGTKPLKEVVVKSQRRNVSQLPQLQR
jgi:hypothetical protein